MRKQLGRMNEERLSFVASFERYGEKPAYKGPAQRTILLKDVADAKTGKVVTDHIWFTLGENWRKLGRLQQGDRVRFDARVKKYTKGYRGRRDDPFAPPVSTDYKLSHPTKIERLDPADSGGNG